MLLTPETAVPRCTCTVDLISSVIRPYLFRVVVTGEPPHAHRRVYTISADSDDSAAIFSMEAFVAEFGPKIPGVASAAPKARLA